MGYQGFFEMLMITLISSKKLGGYKIMSYTVFTNSERNELTEKLWQDYRDILAFWAQYVNRCKVEPWRHNSECLGNS